MLFSGATYVSINQQTDKVVLLPLGAIEQHGPHLAVSTDTDIVSKIAFQAETELSADIILCPTLPFGSSHHHLAFGGTMSLSATTYTQMLMELVESLLHNGFRRIVLLNGHGGNIIPVKQALINLSNKYDASLKPNIVLVTYWELAGKAFSGEPPMESPALSHACEYETSLMLYLFSDKVLPKETMRAKRPESNGFIPWEDDAPYRGVTMVKQTEFVSGNGSSGEPQLASAEKGKHLFEHAVNSLVQFLNSFKTWPFLEKLSN
jgi:creatinine amidohydrolase